MDAETSLARTGLLPLMHSRLARLALISGSSTLVWPPRTRRTRTRARLIRVRCSGYSRFLTILGTGEMPGGCYLAGRVAWPPNWWRRTDTIFIAGELSARDAKRANSAAVIAGAGMALAIASSTVQRPSPESLT